MFALFVVFSLGSSTDLTPSVIGYYDRLSNSFQHDTIIGEIRKKSPEKQLDELRNKSREQSPKPKLIVSKIPTKPPASALVSKSIHSARLTQNHHNTAPSKTLQIISPNVHRMISSHQTTTETIAATQPSVKSFIYELSQKNIGKKFTEKNSGTNRRILLKSGLPKSLGIATTAIPLSKNLSKISQSNGFVDSSEPIVHTITDNNCNREEIDLIACDSDKTPTNGDHNFNYDNLLNNNYDFNEDDEDDNIQNVLDKTSELINNLLSGNNDRHLSSLDIHEGTKNSVVIDVDSANNSEVKTVNNEEIIMTSSKGKNRHKYQLHMDSESEEERPCEVVNTNLKLTKSLDNVAESDFKPTSSPKLSYSRAKLISTQQLTSPTQSPNLGEKKLGETSSLSDGKLNASPSTKHRPLSAASISSSSSSTSTASSNNSFGAEQSINGKLIGGMTYMASIESLADQSENEVNPSLTMCERAALEIIDSEKSFVADLGQIIRGFVNNLKLKIKI